MARQAHDEPEAALLAEAALWCVRLADDPVSDEERQAFDAWLGRSDACRRAFSDTMRAWRGLEEIATGRELLAMRAAALADLGAARHRKQVARICLPRRWLALAAAVLVLLLGYGVYSQLAYTTYRTDTGERRLVLLDDGSQLSLDADTRVQVRYTPAQRELRLLRGRAKFDVAHDALRPFTVAAGRRIVLATGTEFSVELLTHQLQVILYEGRVNVLAPAAGAGDGRSRAETKLLPGHELVVNLATDQGQVQENDPASSRSWESGFLTFANEPLQAAVDRMNRYTPIKFAVANAETARLLVNGVYPTANPQAFIEGVTGVLPVRLELRQGIRTFVRTNRPAVVPAGIVARSANTPDNISASMRLTP